MRFTGPRRHKCGGTPALSLSPYFDHWSPFFSIFFYQFCGSIRTASTGVGFIKWVGLPCQLKGLKWFISKNTGINLVNIKVWNQMEREVRVWGPILAMSLEQLIALSTSLFWLLFSIIAFSLLTKRLLPLSFLGASSDVQRWHGI